MATHIGRAMSLPRSAARRRDPAFRTPAPSNMPVLGVAGERMAEPRLSRRGPGQAPRPERAVRRRSSAAIRILAQTIPAAMEAKAKICIILWFPALGIFLSAGKLAACCGGALSGDRMDPPPAW